MASRALQLTNWFPAVSVTGPRQSGKSALVKEVFSDYAHVNLENPQTRRQALNDSVGFIGNRPNHLVIDEAQLAPEPSPLSFAEARAGVSNLMPDSFMLRGGCPRLYDVDIPQEAFFSAYMETYVERDVRDYLGVRDLSSYRMLLELCAQCTGSLLNVSRLAGDAGVSRESVSSWLSMPESSYVVFRLRPYYANLRKRLAKTPKLYFYDTGLLCYLLRIRTLDQLLTSPYLGMVFENLVIEERMKAHLNAGGEPDLYFYRDENKTEVDLVDLTDPDCGIIVGIKSSQTYRSSFSRHLRTVGDEIGIPVERRFVVERAEGDFEANGTRVRSIATWLEMS